MLKKYGIFWCRPRYVESVHEEIKPHHHIQILSKCTDGMLTTYASCHELLHKPLQVHPPFFPNSAMCFPWSLSPKVGLRLEKYSPVYILIKINACIKINNTVNRQVKGWYLSSISTGKGFNELVKSHVAHCLVLNVNNS